jgi:hypothetical protein
MKQILCMAILSATSFLALGGDPVQLGGDPSPVMLGISQKAAKPGEIVTVSGEGLGVKNVDEIYLTDHKFDMRVKVVEQKDNAVKFRIPPFAKPGRMQLLFLSKGTEPKLLEQPVYLLIQDPSEVTEVEPTPAPAPAPALPTTTPAPKEEPKIEAKADVAKEVAKPDPKPDQRNDQRPPK